MPPRPASSQLTAAAMSSHTCFQPAAPTACCFAAPGLPLTEAGDTGHRAGGEILDTPSPHPEQTPVSTGPLRGQFWVEFYTVGTCGSQVACPRMPLEWLLFLWNHLPLDLTSCDHRDHLRVSWIGGSPETPVKIFKLLTALAGAST